jgi:putative transposase
MTTSLPQGAPTIARMCSLAGVSRAGYYRNWAACEPRQEEAAVRDMVQRVALAEKYYGYRRVAVELRRAGFAVNHKRVLRLMREDNLLCLRRRAFVPATTDSNHDWRVVPNLTHGIVLTGIDQLWVADITYIRMLEEFAYLAVVLDAFSRRVIGWALETHLQASLAIAALTMALAARRPAPGSLIHHSDRGVQYACCDYAAILQAHDIRPSMSRIGCPYDNAKAESFMKTLKQEEGRRKCLSPHRPCALGDRHVLRRGLQSPPLALGTCLSITRRVRNKPAAERDLCAETPLSGVSNLSLISVSHRGGAVQDHAPV